MNKVMPVVGMCLALAACGDKTETLHGYAEGKFVMLAPETTGRVKAVAVLEQGRKAAPLDGDWLDGDWLDDDWLDGDAQRNVGASSPEPAPTKRRKC